MISHQAAARVCLSAVFLSYPNIVSDKVAVRWRESWRCELTEGD